MRGILCISDGCHSWLIITPEWILDGVILFWRSFRNTSLFELGHPKLSDISSLSLLIRQIRVRGIVTWKLLCRPVPEFHLSGNYSFACWNRWMVASTLLLYPHERKIDVGDTWTNWLGITTLNRMKVSMRGLVCRGFRKHSTSVIYMCIQKQVGSSSGILGILLLFKV